MSHDTALRRVCAGYIEPQPRTFTANDALWCRLVSQGRIIDRHHDSASKAYRVHLVIIEHPELSPPEVYAAFASGGGPFSVYRCLAVDAREALFDPSAFNL